MVISLQNNHHFPTSKLLSCACKCLQLSLLSQMNSKKKKKKEKKKNPVTSDFETSSMQIRIDLSRLRSTPILHRARHFHGKRGFPPEVQQTSAAEWETERSVASWDTTVIIHNNKSEIGKDSNGCFFVWNCE